ncbi:hypothetical protein ACSBO6_05365 [Bacillus sp. AL-1R]
MSVFYLKNNGQKNQLSLDEVSQRATQRALKRLYNLPDIKESPTLKRFDEIMEKVGKGKYY